MAEQSPKVRGVEGKCCKDANTILDLSQGVSSKGQTANLVGHPRYHVLCDRNYNKVDIINNLESKGCTEVVTDYQGNTKTAFLTRDDQNRTLHEILTSQKGREALDLLNQGRTEVILKTPVNELNLNRNLMMSTVSHGSEVEKSPANSTVLILGHHQNEKDGMYVHVKTFYPTDQALNGTILDVTKS